MSALLLTPHCSEASSTSFLRVPLWQLWVLTIPHPSKLIYPTIPGDTPRHFRWCGEHCNSTFPAFSSSVCWSLPSPVTTPTGVCGFLPTRSWSMRISSIELKWKVVHPMSTPLGNKRAWRPGTPWITKRFLLVLQDQDIYKHDSWNLRPILLIPVMFLSWWPQRKFICGMGETPALWRKLRWTKLLFFFFNVDSKRI